MSRILIFGGTTEGRLLAQALARRGVPAAVSVATVLGAEELSGLPGITPLVGRRTAEEMAALLSGYDKCVDATHPYAREVSANIRSACRSAGVPLRRLLRRTQLADGFRLFFRPGRDKIFLVIVHCVAALLLGQGRQQPFQLGKVFILCHCGSPQKIWSIFSL